MRFDGLPGADLVGAGLADLARGVESTEALLVSFDRGLERGTAGAPRRHARDSAVDRREAESRRIGLRPSI